MFVNNKKTNIKNRRSIQCVKIAKINDLSLIIKMG